MMNKLKSVFFIYLIMSCSHLYAQETSRSFFDLLSPRHDRYDSLYIENHSNDLLLRLYSVYKFNGFNLSVKEANSRISFFSPPQVNIGAGFNYKWLGINIGLNFRFINPHLKKYGKQSRFDCQFQLYQRKFVIDGIFQYYKGFFINQNSFVPKNDDLIVTMPGLRMIDAGCNFLYNFNHDRFSYQAAFINTEVQKRSAGSVLLGGNFLWEQLKGDTVNVMNQFPYIFNDSINLSKMYFINFGIMAGYAYTLVFAKDFYFSIALTPGINIEISDVSGGQRKPHVSPMFKFTTRAAIGYNKGRFFTSFIYYMDGNVGSHHHGSVFYYSGNARLNVGMRLSVNKRKTNKSL